MSITTEQKRANLEALAGKLSRITGEKIEIVETEYCFRFSFPMDTLFLHHTVVQSFQSILEKTSKTEETGLLIYIKDNEIYIHTSTI